MRCVCVSAALMLTLAAPAQAEMPPPFDQPILRIETGMHGAEIRGLGVDASCRFMLTGSEDKTGRLWALPESETGEPKLLHVLRVPIAPGEDGKIHAAALSPDGRLAVVGGWDRDDNSDGIYVFDTATGTLVRRIAHVSYTTLHLTFSPDGRYLAAALGTAGIRVWETNDWHLVGEDEDYNSQRSDGAAFDAEDRLYTVAYDGFLRRYGPDFKLEMKSMTSGEKEPQSVAVHPSGKWLAVGFSDSSDVEVYDAKSLQRVFAADTRGAGTLSQVAWSADGARLYAGGGRGDLRIWDNEGRGPWRDVALARHAIRQILPCRDVLAVSASDPAFGLVTLSGDKRVWQDGAIPDMRGKNGGVRAASTEPTFTVSADARRVRFGLGYGIESPFLFDVTSGQLNDLRRFISALSAPDTDSLKLTDWVHEYVPKLDDRVIGLDAYETAHAVAIAPGADRFVLATDWSLRAYNKDGKQLWRQPTPEAAWGVNVARGGMFVVAAYGDGTIRWHRLRDGEEVLALFVNAKTREWVLWTPQGYYTASAAGAELIGWHLNNGWEQAGDFVTAAQLKKSLNRPDIVKRAFELADAEQAVREAGLSTSDISDLIRRSRAEESR
jgi:hypothetical protein